MIRRSLLCIPLLAQAVFALAHVDRRHDSAVFGEPRNYRLFLPPGYENSGKRYPVIYYFHGHSDRYTLEKYDDGKDTVPKIAAFVDAHDVIVVAPDGYVARDYTGFYGGFPYDLRRDGEIDYGAYFLELVRHVDASYRTLATRRYRATSGLSMGGFMSLYLSARFPDLIGSASSFNSAPEFYAGEKGRRSLWRPKDHVLNHEATMVRLVRASGDYISQYHEETRAAYAVQPTVDFEFRQDEYHRHWATSIGETFEFHVRAFAKPSLDGTPESWNYTSAQRSFDIWGFRVSSDQQGPAFVELARVSSSGLGLQTRQWAPDGPPASCASLSVSTAPLYRPGAAYDVVDFSHAAGTASIRELTADWQGRLLIQSDCSGHEFGINGPGVGAPAPVLLPLTPGDYVRPAPGVPVHLPIRILNPGATPLRGLRAVLSSEYPTVEIGAGGARQDEIAPGAVVDLTGALLVRFTASDEGFARTRFNLDLTFEGGSTRSRFDVLVQPDLLASPAAIMILDGRTETFSVFRQTGNQGGGGPIRRTVSEGRGNANGVLEPGEEATIWIQLRQGLDPFDKNNWCRAKVYSGSPWLIEVADIQEEKQREWTGAQSRTSLVRLSPAVPPGLVIPLVLDCESWSFAFTPDVRYGPEPLYQAFQSHKHHLFLWNWKLH